MARKLKKPSFDDQLEQLRLHGFAVAASAVAPGAMLVSKSGAAAILVPAAEGGTAYAVHPGMLVNGAVARLVDRGYQKFLTTADIELPATAAQLHAIHCLSEELSLLTGGISLYNEGLGTTSDLYTYDRLKGRETAQPRAARPWELGGH